MRELCYDDFTLIIAKRCLQRLDTPWYHITKTTVERANTWNTTVENRTSGMIPSSAVNRSCLLVFLTAFSFQMNMMVVLMWKEQHAVPIANTNMDGMSPSPNSSGVANPASASVKGGGGGAAINNNTSSEHQLSVPKHVASTILRDRNWTTTNNNNYNTTSSSSLDLPPECCSTEHCALIQHTTAYRPCCVNASSSSLPAAQFIFPLLITGTPRSGTVFVSNLLSSLGLKLANDGQQPRKYGIVSWLHLYKDYYPDLPWTKRPPSSEGFRFRHIVHQVRDPLASVTSIAFTEPIGSAHYLGFLSRHIPLTDTVTHFDKTDHDPRYDRVRITRTLEFYVGWHEVILQLRVPRFRLEDFVLSSNNNTLIADLFVRAGLPAPSAAAIQHQLHRRQLRQRRRQRRQLKYSRTQHHPPNGTLRMSPKQQQQHQQQHKKELNKNHRAHRPTLEWEELCDVHVALTRRFLVLSHELGYYHNMTSVCV